MSILTYLLGVCISAALWFILTKFRQKGFHIPMPRQYDGNLLDPLNHKNVDWNLLMLGWFIMAVFWPVGWSLLVLLYAVAWLVTIIGFLWVNTIGNEKLARKIFGGKE